MSRICVGSIGKNGKNNDAPAMLNILPKFELVPIKRYFMTLPNALRPSRMPRLQAAQIMFEKNNIGGVARHVHGRRDRYADIGGVQRGRIVDAVAEKTDHVVACSGMNDVAVFLRRRNPGKDRDVFRHLSQRGHRRNFSNSAPSTIPVRSPSPT